MAIVEQYPSSDIRERGRPPADENAYHILERAGSLFERCEAIDAALNLGVSLHEIEEWLDWLDAVRTPKPNRTF